MAGFGFIPYRRYDGLPYNGNTETKLLTAASTKLHHGDAVGIDASGTLIRSAANTDIFGIAVGFTWTDSSGNYHATNYISAADNVANTVTCTYIPIDGMIFRVRGNSAATFLLAADVGSNADHVDTDGSAVTGISGQVLAAVTGSATAQWRIVGVATEPIGNAVGSADSVFLVIANETWRNAGGVINVGI